MNIKLNRIRIQSFKGIKDFELIAGGENINIVAANGKGKTTVFDAFLWLLFDKDSSGRKNFELRPLGKNNQPIKGLTLSVQAELDIDGTVHVFKKEHTEKIVKKEFRGYETAYWIDEVPKKAGEYSDYVDNLIAEDTFKMLTDLSHFNGKLHWSDRRKVLLDIAGEIGKPEGFDGLMATLNGRTIEEYKKVLAEQKKKHTKERDEINPRIDEIQKGLDEYAELPPTAVEAQRAKVLAEIQALNTKRTAISLQEKERQSLIDKKNEIIVAKLNRESSLATETSGTELLLKERALLASATAKMSEMFNLIGSQVSAKVLEIETAKRELTKYQTLLAQIRIDYTNINDAVIDTNCYACGQSLPAEKVTELADKRKNELKAIAENGTNIKAKVKACQNVIEGLEANLADLNSELAGAEKGLIATSEKEQKRSEEITKLIESSHVTIPPDKDPVWLDLDKRLQEVTAAIGEPVSAQLEALDALKATRTEQLNKLNESLVRSDQMRQAKIRIAELEASEKDLSQKIAGIEEELASIDSYKEAESSLISNAVNGKFKHVEFKLFKELLNGGTEDCCEATFNGVPYADLSTGQQIFVGIDIVNVLSEHYGLSVPLFIDHIESLTLSIEANSQVIGLRATPGVEELTIEGKSK